MNSRMQLIKVLGIIALAAMVGVGCASRSNKYTGNSESMNQDGTSYEESVALEQDSTSPSGQSQMSNQYSPEGEYTSPGTEAFAPPPLQDNKWAYSGDQPTPDIDHQGMEYVSPDDDNKPGDWAGYGHDYAGVPGYGPGSGPVTGFSSTQPEQQEMTVDPETWANAYLQDGISGDGLSAEQIQQDLVATDDDPNSPYGTRGSGSRSRNGMPNDPRYQDLDSRNLEFAGLEYTSNGEVKDVYYEFDSWKITPAGARSLESDAEWLKAHSDKTVTIEGHCDLRGTQNYNVVLGKKRAEAARDYLVDLGVNPAQLQVVSYGKERPFCAEQNEYCYQKNRRSHFVSRTQ